MARQAGRQSLIKQDPSPPPTSRASASYTLTTPLSLPTAVSLCGDDDVDPVADMLVVLVPPYMMECKNDNTFFFSGTLGVRRAFFRCGPHMRSNIMYVRKYKQGQLRSFRSKRLRRVRGNILKNIHPGAITPMGAKTSMGAFSRMVTLHKCVLTKGLSAIIAFLCVFQSFVLSLVHR